MKMIHVSLLHCILKSMGQLWLVCPTYHHWLIDWSESLFSTVVDRWISCYTDGSPARNYSARNLIVEVNPKWLYGAPWYVVGCSSLDAGVESCMHHLKSVMGSSFWGVNCSVLWGRDLCDEDNGSKSSTLKGPGRQPFLEPHKLQMVALKGKVVTVWKESRSVCFWVTFAYSAQNSKCPAILFMQISPNGKIVCKTRCRMKVWNQVESRVIAGTEVFYRDIAHHNSKVNTTVIVIQLCFTWRSCGISFL